VHVTFGGMEICWALLSIGRASVFVMPCFLHMKHVKLLLLGLLIDCLESLSARLGVGKV